MDLASLVITIQDVLKARREADGIRAVVLWEGARAALRIYSAEIEANCTGSCMILQEATAEYIGKTLQLVGVLCLKWFQGR